jgi:hypothetical protein
MLTFLEEKRRGRNNFSDLQFDDNIKIDARIVECEYVKRFNSFKGKVQWWYFFEKDEPSGSVKVGNFLLKEIPAPWS